MDLVVAKALRQARRPQTAQRVSDRRRAEADAAWEQKLAAKGFTSLADLAEYAQAQGWSWHEMSRWIGESHSATRARAEREGVDVWRAPTPLAQEMLEAADTHARKRGNLEGVTGELSRWLATRRY